MISNLKEKELCENNYEDQQNDDDQNNSSIQYDKEQKTQYGQNQQQHYTNTQTKYNEIFVFGCNKYGQIGLSEKNAGKNFCIPRFCHFNIIFTSVSCGAHHSVLLTQDGYAYTVGSNIYGQLGVETNQLNYSYTPILLQKLQDFNIIKVVSGSYHNLALTSDKQVYSWGRNTEGQLGLGQTGSYFSSPSLIEKSNNILNIFSGWNHSFFITKQYELYSFGSGLYGQLGQGKCEGSYIPKKVLFDEQQFKITKIACGDTHTLFLNEQGHIYVCGENQRGQLGLGRNKKVVLQPQCLSNQILFNSESIVDISCSRFSIAVTQKSQSVYVWGQIDEFDSNPIYIPQCIMKLNQNQQNLKCQQIKNVVRKITVGGNSCIILMKNGDMYSWGKNQFGECGQGDFESKLDTFYPINFLKGKKILTFHMGENHSIVLGREIYQRDQEKLQNNINDSQQMSSHCASHQEITLLEKSQSFICSDDQMIECSNQSSFHSSSSAIQNNLNQSENQESSVFHFNRKQSFQQNESVSDKDSCKQINQQKYQFMQSKTPNFLNENSSQQSHQNSRQVYHSNQREKLQIVCRDIERTHSPIEQYSQKNQQNHFNSSKKQTQSFCNQIKSRKDNEINSTQNNQIQCQENEYQNYEDINKSCDEKDKNETQQDLFKRTNIQNKNDQIQNGVNLNEFKQQKVNKYSYFVSDKAPNYLDKRISSNELTNRDNLNTTNNFEKNNMMPCQMVNTPKTRSLTPQHNTTQAKDYETFSNEIGDQFMNYTQLVNSNINRPNINPYSNQLEASIHSQTAQSNQIQYIKQDRNNELPLQMKQILTTQKDSGSLSLSQAQNRLTNISEKSIDTMCSVTNQMTLQSQEMQSNEVNLQNGDQTYQSRNTSSFFGVQQNIESYDQEQNSKEESRGFNYSNLNDKLNQMNNAFQGLIKKLAIENFEINDQILKSIPSSSTSKQQDERNNPVTSSRKVLLTNPSDASMTIGVSENQNYFTLDTNSHTNNAYISPRITSQGTIGNYQLYQDQVSTIQQLQSKEILNDNISQSFQKQSFQNLQKQHDIGQIKSQRLNQFEEQQQNIENYLIDMQQQQPNLEQHQFYFGDQQQIQNQEQNQYLNQYILNKQYVDLEIQRQQQQLHEILQLQNASILQSINKFKQQIYDQKNDVNMQSKIKKLETILASTTHQLDSSQKEKQRSQFKIEDKENNPTQNKQINNQSNSTQFLPSFSQSQIQSRGINTHLEQKFDSQIQNMSIQLSQKDRDIADLQLTLANKEMQIQSLELKSNINQIQNEQMQQTLEKALSIIENFQLFSNNFTKLR